MLEYFKNIAEKNSCSTGAVCSIHPSVNSLYEIILIEISEISFYIVKLARFGIENNSVNEFLIEGLSVFLINTSFNQKKYLDLILKLENIRKLAKEKYINYCKDKNLPYEIINKNLQINSSTTISQLISYSDNYINTKHKNIDFEKQRLFELIILMTKLASINILKIKKLNYNNSFDYQILKFFSTVNDYLIKKEKIIKRIIEFSHLLFEIKNKLYALQREKFGQKETTNVNLSIENGYNILVSGDDFDELDRVLKEVENYENEAKEEINVYTNGALFLANFYPYFKNNKYLKGHWGGDNAEFDFSNFTGSILITQNFVQKIDSLYRGEIFSKKLISFSKVSDIENNDYKPIVDACLKFNKTIKSENKEIPVKYDKNKLSNLKDGNFVLIVGKLNNKIQEDKIFKQEIIFMNAALEGELLLEKVNWIKENSMKPKIFFSECSLCNLDLLFAILNFEFEIYFVNCSNTLINPYVIEALKEDFNVKII